MSALRGHGKRRTVSSDNQTERYFWMHARPFVDEQHHDKSSKKGENDDDDGDGDDDDDDDDGVNASDAAVNEERVKVCGLV